MKGYVARKGDRWYAVIYEGIDPVTGREQRSWHAAGTDRADAERLAARLAAEPTAVTARPVRSPSAPTSPAAGCPASRSCSRPARTPAIAATWNATSFLPWDASRCGASGRTTSRPSTARCYGPATTARGWHRRPCTRSISSSAARSTDAVRRGLVTRNVALVAHAPRMRAIPKVEQRSWTAEELQAFLRAAAGHRLFAALWTAAFTGMRRNELLGLGWDDLDATKATLSINRGLVAIGYDLHETRGKTANARRRIDLDPTTIAVLGAWRAWQTTEQCAVGIEPSGRMFTDGHGETVHPHAISQTFERIARRAGVTHDPTARRAPHPRHAAHRGRRARQGRERTTRSLQADVHHRHLPARAARHASRRRPRLRTAHRSRRSTGVEAPVEGREKRRKKTA